MNKRLQELEKKAIDARCTYEKIRERVDKLTHEISDTRIKSNEITNKDACVCTLLEWFKLREEAKRELSKAIMMVDECDKITKIMEDMSVDIRNKIDEVDKGINLVATNKNGVELKTSISKTKELMRKHREAEIKNNKIRTLKKKKKNMVQKMNQITRFCENSETKLSILLEKYETLNAGNGFIPEFKDMDEAHTYSVETKREIERINEYIKSQELELKKLEGKLEISKDKMEEAEYQFKEYKHMIEVS